MLKCDSIFIILPFGKYLTHLQLCADFSFHFISSFHFIYVAASRLSTQTRDHSWLHSQEQPFPIKEFIYVFSSVFFHFFLALLPVACWLFAPFCCTFMRNHISKAINSAVLLGKKKKKHRNWRRKLCSFARF